MLKCHFFQITIIQTKFNKYTTLLYTIIGQKFKFPAFHPFPGELYLRAKHFRSLKNLGDKTSAFKRNYPQAQNG